MGATRAHCASRARARTHLLLQQQRSGIPCRHNPPLRRRQLRGVFAIPRAHLVVHTVTVKLYKWRRTNVSNPLGLAFRTRTPGASGTRGRLSSSGGDHRHENHATTTTPQTHPPRRLHAAQRAPRAARRRRTRDDATKSRDDSHPRAPRPNRLPDVDHIHHPEHATAQPARAADAYVPARRCHPCRA